MRELLVAPSRYGQLLDALESIATNMLAQRLRELESSGIIERRLQDGSVVYALTEWGEGLREPIEALVRWSEPLMARGKGSDSYNPRWLLIGLRSLLSRRSSRRAHRLGLRVGDRLFELHRDRHGTTVTLDPAHEAQATFTAGPELILALAAGAIPTERAIAAGHLRGDEELLAKVFARD